MLSRPGAAVGAILFVQGKQRTRKPLEALLIIADRGEHEHTGGGSHLRLEVEALAQCVVQLHGGRRICAHRMVRRGRTDQNSGGIVRPQEGVMRKRSPFIKPSQAIGIGIEKHVLLLRKKLNALVDGCHQDVAGAAGLEDTQVPAQPPAVSQRSVHMNQRGLCEGGKRLVQAVDHKIRPQLHGGFGEDLMHSKMRSVRFINDQGHTVLMRYVRDPLHITDDTIVGGRGHEDSTDVLAGLQCVRNPVWINRAAVRQSSCAAFLRGIQIQCLQPAQGSCMISGPVAVSRHQQTTAGRGARADRAQNTRGASIYKEMRLAAAV